LRELFAKLLEERKESVDYMTGQITRICRDLPPRSPGSEGEKAAAAYLAKELRGNCGCDEVRTESFCERPGAFYGYLYFSAALDVLCALSFFIAPWLSLLFGIAAILLMLFQFILYRQVVDPFFPEKQGTNVTAVRRSRAKPRRRVFFNGHIDAAWEWPVNYYLGGVAYAVHVVLTIVGVVFYCVLAVLRILGAGAWVRTAALCGLAFIPFWVGLVFLWDRRRVVDGANDDLSGCMMGMALLRALNKSGVRLEDTEVGVILTGSEEAGLRGAKAWCAAHGGEYRDVPTYIFSYDTIHDPRFLMTNERDLNGTVRSDRALSALFLRAAGEVGVPCRRGWVPPMGGATDSAAFTHGGFRSVGITGLSHKLEPYYHTRRDSYDNLNAEGLENCYAATVRTLELIEGGALEDGD